MDLAAVARKAASLDAEIKLKAEELGALKEKLIAGGAADYGVCIVIFPSGSIKIGEQNFDPVKALLGDDFGSLFEKVVSFKPMKNCRDRADALLPPGKFRKFLELTEVPGSPRVAF